MAFWQMFHKLFLKRVKSQNIKIHQYFIIYKSSWCNNISVTLPQNAGVKGQGACYRHLRYHLTCRVLHPIPADMEQYQTNRVSPSTPTHFGLPQPNHVTKNTPIGLPNSVKYDGTKSWQAFYTKFEKYAEASNWSVIECRKQLRWCLERKVSEFHTMLADRRQDNTYIALVRRFEKRFGDLAPATQHVVPLFFMLKLVVWDTYRDTSIVKSTLCVKKLKVNLHVLCVKHGFKTCH